MSAVELGRQHDRVFVANPKYDKRGDITHHRGAGLLAQARHELGGHGEREAVLAGLREDLRDHFRAEQLDFIDHDMKRYARLLRKGGARDARGLHAGKQERAHEVGWCLSVMPRARLAMTDATTLHGLLEMQAAAGLADHIADRGREEKGVDLVENRRDRFLAIAIAPAIELAFEKIPRQRIGDASGDAGAKPSIGQKPRQQSERRVRRLEERRGRVAKNLFEPWPHMSIHIARMPATTPSATTAR